MNRRQPLLAACAALALALAACGGGGGSSGSSTIPGTSAGATSAPTTSPTSTPTTNPTATPTTSPTATPITSVSASYTCPSATTSSGALDCTKLPIGDLKYSTSGPSQGEAYLCNAPSGTPPSENVPWIDRTTNTWDMLTKLVVEGSNTFTGQFSVTVNGATRSIAGDDLPTTYWPVGTYPISKSDPAYQYDGNPNSVIAQNFSFSVPTDPTEATTPGCLTGGPVAVTVTGVEVYDAFDAAGYDANANEEQDDCHGHPDGSDTYHIHGFLQDCVPDAGSPTQNSSLLGYAADGFGIYGPWYNGKILTSADLDECHGTTSPVMWDGKLVTMYHYVSTYDFPYTLACYRGTATRI